MRTLYTALASGALGLTLLVAAVGGGAPAQAAPLFNITSVPTEPPTSTPVPATNTPAPATSTPAPSATPAVVNATDAPTAPAPSPATDPAEHHARLTIRKIADQAVAQVGDLIGFSVVVENTGDATAHNVVVTDGLPAYFALVDFSSTHGTTSINGQALSVAIGDLAPQDSVLIRVRAYVLGSAPATASNTAVLQTGLSSTATFEVRQPAPTPLPPAAMPPAATLVPVPPTAIAPPPTAMPPAPRPPTVRPARLPVTAEDPTTTAPGTVIFGGAFGLSVLALGMWLRRRPAR